MQGHGDEEPHTATEETLEEVREALAGEEEPEKSEDEHSGEAGDALRPSEKRQEWAHGEPPE